MRVLTKNSIESEKSIERYLTIRCSAKGWLCLKYAVGIGGVAGFPDRMICTGGGHTAWVEVKSAGKELRPLQATRAAQLRAFGYRVFTVSSRAEVDALLATLEVSAR